MLGAGKECPTHGQEKIKKNSRKKFAPSAGWAAHIEMKDKPKRDLGERCLPLARSSEGSLNQPEDGALQKAGPHLLSTTGDRRLNRSAKAAREANPELPFLFLAGSAPLS